MDWPRPGTTITPTKRTEAYYSGYAGRPECFLEPGDRATVVSVDVPPVTGRRGNFLTADFTRGGERWTVALRPGEYFVVDGGQNARAAAMRIARGRLEVGRYTSSSGPRTRRSAALFSFHAPALAMAYHAAWRLLGARRFDLAGFVRRVGERYGGDSRSNGLIYGGCVNFALAAIRALRREGLEPEFVFIGWDHAAVRAGGAEFDGAGPLTPVRKKRYADRWDRVEEQTAKELPGYVPLPGRFITTAEFTDELEYGCAYTADGISIPEMWSEAHEPAEVRRLEGELSALARAGRRRASGTCPECGGELYALGGGAWCPGCCPDEGDGGPGWEPPPRLYHGTSLGRLRGMLARPESFELYLASSPEGTEMYARAASDEDGTPQATVAFDTAALKSSGALMPDWDDVESMIRGGETDADGDPLFGDARSAEDVPWRESLRLIGTCSYEGPLSGAMAEVDVEGEVHRPPFAGLAG